MLVGVSGGYIRLFNKVDDAIDFARIGGKVFAVADGKIVREVTEEVFELALKKNALQLSNASDAEVKQIVKAIEEGKNTLSQIDDILKETDELKRVARFNDVIANKASDDLTTLLAKSGDDITILTNARKLPGTATGTAKKLQGNGYEERMVMPVCSPRSRTNPFVWQYANKS